MSRKRRKHGRRGHFCWACGRMRPNEKFSGRGHSRHLCKDYARLGTEELDYRQTMRNLERLLSAERLIPRRKRRQFEKYLHHKDARVRAYALELETADAWTRAERRLYRDLGDFLDDLAAGESIVPF